jgi:hypothetical protein
MGQFHCLKLNLHSIRLDLKISLLAVGLPILGRGGYVGRLFYYLFLVFLLQFKEVITLWLCFCSFFNL